MKIEILIILIILIILSFISLNNSKFGYIGFSNPLLNYDLPKEQQFYSRKDAPYFEGFFNNLECTEKYNVTKNNKIVKERIYFKFKTSLRKLNESDTNIFFNINIYALSGIEKKGVVTYTTGTYIFLPIYTIIDANVVADSNSPIIDRKVFLKLNSKKNGAVILRNNSYYRFYITITQKTEDNIKFIESKLSVNQDCFIRYK